LPTSTARGGATRQIRRCTWLVVCLMAGCATAPAPQVQQRSEWAGLPPDCWTQVRNYQTESDDWDWPARTRIEHVVATRPKAVTLSPNGAYYFALPEEMPQQSILIFAEKDRLVRISFPDAKGLTDVKWINEKLLYLRPWWGRVAATDLVFDVEKERVLLAESTHDGATAMEQSRDMCPRLGGCQCIPKDPR
jgi:hypothetical protein